MLKLAKAMIGILPALMLAACVTRAEEPTTSNQEQLLRSFNDDGAVSNVWRVADAEPSTSSRSAENRNALAPPPPSPLTSGCTHIRFCDGPGADEVICDTNDKTTGACTRAARENECVSDADAVCGNWTLMRFDPPI